MDITEEDEFTVTMITGIHNARHIGEAVSRTYQGDLLLAYGNGEKTIRVL